MSSLNMQPTSSKKWISLAADVVAIASIVIALSDVVLNKCLPYRIGPEQYTQYLWAERLFPVSFLAAIAASFFCLALRKRLLLIMVCISLASIFVFNGAPVHSGP